jgi:spore coat protein U-like protein
MVANVMKRSVHNAHAEARGRKGGGAWLRASLALVACSWAAAAAAAPECTLHAAADMVFTAYTPFGSGASATSTVTYRCPTAVRNAWIGVSGPRVMTAGGESLSFDVYQGPYPAPTWGDQPPVAVPLSTTGSVTIHGFLPPQDAAAGSYLATLTVTIYSGTQQNATATVPLAVSTSGFADTCTIGAGALAFGSYDPVGANAVSPLDAQATIEIACTRATQYAVGLGPGSFAAGSVRRMASGGDRLEYELYADAARTTIWSTTTTVGGTAPSTAPIQLVVHGRVLAGQAAAAGAYADVVQSTINF